MDHYNHYILLGFYLSVVAILTITAVLTNGFIVTVNIRDWLKGRILNPVEGILVALSLSNAGLSYSFGNYIFFVSLWPQFFLVDYPFTVVFALMFFLTLSSSWLSAWLCFYFFVKIINLKSPYLIKLKLTMDVAVPWLIVFSEVVSFSSSVPVIWLFSRLLPHNVTSCNQTCPIVSMQLNQMYYTYALGFSSCSALLIVIVSAVCIVRSLCRHTYQMKKTMSREEYSQIRTHQRAAQTVGSLLLIYIVFYVTYVLMTSNSIYYWMTVWVLLSTSSAMSLVLILGNSKLYLAFHKIFCCSPPLD